MTQAFPIQSHFQMRSTNAASIPLCLEDPSGVSLYFVPANWSKYYTFKCKYCVSNAQITNWTLNDWFSYILGFHNDNDSSSQTATKSQFKTLNKSLIFICVICLEVIREQLQLAIKFLFNPLPKYF